MDPGLGEPRSVAQTDSGDPVPPSALQSAAAEDIRLVPLPVGWEGLSFKLRGERCIVSEVPKSCFSSAAFAASAASKSQVEGVSAGDEIVTLNGETPARFAERISTGGDPWNACSWPPSHEVASKTKFDSPPCPACDFIRRRRTLGFDVALQMWMRAAKRDIKIVLGVRSGGALPDETSQGESQSRDPWACLATGATQAASSSDSCKRSSSIVELKASAVQANKMEEAIARLTKLDDLARDKGKQVEAKAKKEGKGKGKGKNKRPTGPYLTRTRLSTSLVTGEVVEWKGKFGWIKPFKPIDHPKAARHKGRLYIHSVDLEWWVHKLTPGSICRFHVYSDANSLGAEECTELGEQSVPQDWEPSAWMTPGYDSGASSCWDTSWDAGGGEVGQTGDGCCQDELAPPPGYWGDYGGRQDAGAWEQENLEPSRTESLSYGHVDLAPPPPPPCRDRSRSHGRAYEDRKFQ